ncbi:hypothetical protein I3842_01G083800 [Carya illinoinensis]|uniref:HAT C-terminal dimerisation domain-containing protein n=1 Tax=Carya illinoinensis TaxID=32201 RepID=A0A922G127_CARIL|nr:hypothetical protein I3842_01G083800 [Carya illinoinensis]
MTVILRFVDVDILSRHCLDIQNIRGQGYDGTSNIHGEWNGLQTLFIKDYPYPYYVHCFAHRLQLALVVASKEVVFEIMGITDVFCQVLQQKSQDILNAMNMVSTTKKFDIDIPELCSRYVQGRGRHQRDHITIEHHYHFEIFNVTIDFQMQELDNKFGEGTTKLLILSSALDLKDGYKSFNIDDICCLVEEYYPLDFSENEKINSRFQLEHFEVKVFSNPILVCLILTILVSIATSERVFSAMKIVKTRLRNKIEDEFLANNLVVYIERKIAKNFDLNSILDNFVCLKERKLQF